MQPQLPMQLPAQPPMPMPMPMRCAIVVDLARNLGYEPIVPDAPAPRPARRRRVLRVLLSVVGVLFLLVAVAAVGAYRMYRGLTSVGRVEGSATGLRKVEPVAQKGSLVVAAHPEAARLGRQILDAGGTALDAAVAVQAALGLVEPDSSGLAGGAFLLYWDAENEKLLAYDGRERAPLSADEHYLETAEGKPMRFDRAMLGGRAVGVPGVVRMLDLAHRAHGRLAWSKLFEGTIRLADEGFEVTERLHQLVSYDPVLPTMPGLRAYFLDEGGAPWPVGHRLQNPAYAGVLRSLQRDGADALYRGPIAKDLLAAVRGARQPSGARIALNAIWRGLGGQGGGDATSPAPGELTAKDLEQYRAREREPLCRPYRTFRVCGFGPPTSGGVAVLQILGLLQRFEMGKLAPSSPEAVHLFADANRLAFLDRGRWLGDPDAVDVPFAGLLDPAYLDDRAKLLNRERAFSNVGAGTPPGAHTSFIATESPERPSTSHFSIVDRWGNAASMTTSVEGPFGCHVMVRGMVLNNQLTDFSFASQEDGRTVANAPGPGKRPRSSMSPLVVFDGETGKVRYVIGSPGGSRIIAFVALTAIGLMDWGLSPQEAVSLPRIVARDETVEVEDRGWQDETARKALVGALEGMGHEVSVRSLVSGLHVIEVRGSELRAGVDPRREGQAR